MSAARRGTTDLSGVLVLDKPAGITSHDVVSRVRRITGERRVGHTGTLDPAATGVLVVLVGPATRLASLLTAQCKSYEARIVFGSRTDTDDADGTVVESLPVPGRLTDPHHASELLESLIGPHLQSPPAYSAIKKDGRVAHRAARSGDPLALKPRSIEIGSAALLAVDSGPPVAWDIALTVSKGTYVRAIARDLGADQGTAAHLGGLRRTASGRASIEESSTIEDLEAAPDPRDLFVDPVPLLGLPIVHVDQEGARSVVVGGSVPSPRGTVEDPSSHAAVIVHGPHLLAVYHGVPGTETLRPGIVLPGGIAR